MATIKTISRAQLAERTNKLMTLLEEMHEQYEALLALLKTRKESIRVGDVNQLRDCITQEREQLRLIDHTNRQREALATELERVWPSASGRVMDAVAQRLRSPDDNRFQDLRDRLRDTVEAVQHEYAVLKTVGETLLAHVSGLMQRMHLLSSPVAVYGRDGKVGRKRPVVSGLDTRT